ncbi:hypothetical protein U9R90_25925 [Streptomyces sp. E11-3]|uniref:lipase/acyltransferase domain-containing protein n=1 Tax=Streptomyces sp. E11-3 TaxID=3110112 RepID=UPI003981570C
MLRARVDDLVVVVPGILGSRLTDADGHEVWGLSGGALWRGIRTFGGSLRGLALPAGLGDAHPGDGVRPTGLVSDLHALPGIWNPVDGYSGLLRWLEQHFTLRARPGGSPGDEPANLFPFAYDWRLSCRYNAEQLKSLLDRELSRWRESAPERRAAKVVFLCHSMGGLVVRHYVERCGGAETTRRVITLGTPRRGSLDALLHLVNGLRYGWGPFGVDLTAFARSLPSLHQLTPDYACLDAPGGLLYARELTGLPGVDEELLKDAARFHADLREPGAGRGTGTASGEYAGSVEHLVEYLTVSGVLQPTLTTAEFAGEELVPRTTIDGQDEGGDGRVPRLSAEDGSRPAFTPWEQHGSLQNNPAVRQAIWGWLGPEPPTHRAGEDGDVPLSVVAPEGVAAGASYEVTAVIPERVPRHDERVVYAGLVPAGAVGPGMRRTLRNRGGGRYTTSFPGVAAGAYRTRVEVGGAPHTAVTSLLVVEPEEFGHA